MHQVLRTNFFSALFLSFNKQYIYVQNLSIVLSQQYDSAYNYKVMLNPNQAVNSLVIDVHIVEESPLEYVKTPGFSDDVDAIYDPKSVSDEPPKSSKITFRFDREFNC